MHFKEEIAIIEKKFIAKITTSRDDIGITTQESIHNVMNLIHLLKKPNKQI